MTFYHLYFYSLPSNTSTLQEKFYHITDDVLVKHLLGETNVAEQQLVQQWLEADAANRTYYQQLQQVWETSRKLASTSAVDENQAWARFSNKIRTEEKPVIKIPAVNRFQWNKIAASVMVVLALSWIGYRLLRTPPAKEILVQTEQGVLNDTLPDGSVVTLNKHSSISYPSRFNDKTRPIQLKGEAFFQVTPDKSKPFVISVNNVEVTVVGTSFNIKSQDGQTEIVVETGVVRVSKAGTMVELKAHEKILIGAQDTRIAKEEVKDKLYNYYRTKEFVCDDTPLWKLIEVVNEAYGVKISIANETVRNRQINTTFNNESLEQVLSVISMTLSVKITEKGDQYIIE